MTKVHTLMKLLEGATSLQVVRDFLKSKGLRFSAGSWKDLYSKRIEPAINSGELVYADLHQLLRDVEGYGQQHVFLLQCEPARVAEMLKPERVKTVAQEMGLGNVMTNPELVNLPDKPTFVEVGLISAAGKASLVIKQVETRTKQVLTNTSTDPNTGGMVKEYRAEHQRAMNSVRISSDGLLEVRIAARDNTKRYQADVDGLLNAVHPLIPKGEYKYLPLGKAKDKLWDNRDKLKAAVRYSDYTLRNDAGTTLRAATAFSDDDLIEDADALSSMDLFKQDAACISSNIYFKIPDGEKPREIHVLISGELNEFAIPAACTALDYEYVLEQIRQHNQ